MLETHANSLPAFHPPTPYPWGRGAGVSFGVTGAFAEPTEELTHVSFNDIEYCYIFARDIIYLGRDIIKPWH